MGLFLQTFFLLLYMVPYFLVCLVILPFFIAFWSLSLKITYGNSLSQVESNFLQEAVHLRFPGRQRQQHLSFNKILNYPRIIVRLQIYMRVVFLVTFLRDNSAPFMLLPRQLALKNPGEKKGRFISDDTLMVQPQGFQLNPGKVSIYIRHVKRQQGL